LTRLLTRCLASLVLLPCLFGPALADSLVDNPMFGDKQNQFGLYAGGSTGTGAVSRMGSTLQVQEDLGVVELQYAQPSTFFRLPARSSIHVAQIVGQDKTQVVFGLMQEFLLVPNFEHVYAGLGLGIYIKERSTDGRVDSAFTFGEKLFLGYRFDNDYCLELYWRHFSNGDITPVNEAYNFVGLGLIKNF
jgi:hypothetical protein